MRRPGRSTVPEFAVTTCGMTWKPSAGTVSLIITGQLVSLKNRRRMFKSPKSGKMFPAKSADAERYLRDFCFQVPQEYRNLRLGSLKEPLRMVATVYYESRRSDLDVGLLMDCLQVAGVIRNDRDIIEQFLYSAVDAANPRVELSLELI